ncbi:hypothetical protein BKA25_002376 [Actinoalloteichus hymeniacidonis]|uniref:Uncharacterized protein n=1 Tax=Actinoalloteichus hymeniacidonis TaxID=340345 RepID=A0AAC9MYX2_9PSEU|nr:hypothetical protein TL08_15375 [Actinoalloteichus hymeniacidonis]MBB5908060.1 hypothetical protein [Actinoalloteichus hymeniacidonis]
MVDLPPISRQTDHSQHDAAGHRSIIAARTEESTDPGSITAGITTGARIAEDSGYRACTGACTSASCGRETQRKSLHDTANDPAQGY